MEQTTNAEADPVERPVRPHSGDWMLPQEAERLAALWCAGQPLDDLPQWRTAMQVLMRELANARETVRVYDKRIVALGCLALESVHRDSLPKNCGEELRAAVAKACDEALAGALADPIRHAWDEGYIEGVKATVTVVRAALRPNEKGNRPA